MPKSKSKDSRARGEDPQCEALYQWESEYREWNINTLTLAECRLAIRTACARYGLPPPKVIQHRKRALSWQMGDTICLQNGRRLAHGGMNLATALHEAAHYICDRQFSRTQAHGRTFLGILMWLLETAKVAPAKALHASARAHRLRWRAAGPQQCKN